MHTTDLELLLSNYFDLFHSKEWKFVTLFTDALLHYNRNIDYTAPEKLYYLKIKEAMEKSYVYERQKGVYNNILNFTGAIHFNVDGDQPFEQFISYYKYILNYFPAVETCKFTLKLIKKIECLITGEKNVLSLKSLKNLNDRIACLYGLMLE